MQDSSTSDAWHVMRGQLRTAQAVSCALAGGVVMFTIIAFMLRGSMTGSVPPGGQPTPVPGVPVDTLALIAVAVLAGATIAGSALRIARRSKLEARIKEDGGLTTDNARSVGGQIMTSTIVSAALVEGAGLLAGVVILMGGPPWVLGVSTGAIGMILLWIPTAGKVRMLVQQATGMAAT